MLPNATMSLPLEQAHFAAYHISTPHEQEQEQVPLPSAPMPKKPSSGWAAVVSAASNASPRPTTASGITTNTTKNTTTDTTINRHEASGNFTVEVLRTNILPNLQLDGSSALGELTQRIAHSHKCTISIIRRSSSFTFMVKGLASSDTFEIVKRKIINAVMAKTTVKLTVPESIIGTLLGPRGSTISAIQTRTLTRIECDRAEENSAHANITINGDVDGVALARAEILKIVSENSTRPSRRIDPQLFDPVFFPFLEEANSQNAEHLAAIESEFDAKVTYAPGDDSVSLSAPSEDSLIAAEAALAALAASIMAQITTFNVSIPPAKHRFLLNDAGDASLPHDNLKRLFDATRCVLVIPPLSSGSSNIIGHVPAASLTEAFSSVVSRAALVALGVLDMRQFVASAGQNNNNSKINHPRTTTTNNTNNQQTASKTNTTNAKSASAKSKKQHTDASDTDVQAAILLANYVVAKQSVLMSAADNEAMIRIAKDAMEPTKIEISAFANQHQVDNCLGLLSNTISALGAFYFTDIKLPIELRHLAPIKAALTRAINDVPDADVTVDVVPDTHGAAYAIDNIAVVCFDPAVKASQAAKKQQHPLLLLVKTDIEAAVSAVCSFSQLEPVSLDERHHAYFKSDSRSVLKNLISEAVKATSSPASHAELVSVVLSSEPTLSCASARAVAVPMASNHVLIRGPEKIAKNIRTAITQLAERLEDAEAQEKVTKIITVPARFCNQILGRQRGSVTKFRDIIGLVKVDILAPHQRGNANSSAGAGTASVSASASPKNATGGADDFNVSSRKGGNNNNNSGSSSAYQRRNNANSSSSSSSSSASFAAADDDSVRVSILGTQRAVDDVSQMIADRVTEQLDLTVTNLSIPLEFHRRIIGEKGKNVRAMEEKYGVRIQFPRVSESDASAGASSASKADENVVVVRGPSKGVALAVKELNKVAAEEKLSSHRETLRVPGCVISLLIGKSGSKINKLKSSTGVRIDMPPRTDGKEMIEIAIIGHAKSTAVAKRVLQEASKWHMASGAGWDSCVITIPKAYQRRIFTSEYDNLKRIGLESNANGSADSSKSKGKKSQPGSATDASKKDAPQKGKIQQQQQQAVPVPVAQENGQINRGPQVPDNVRDIIYDIYGFEVNNNQLPCEQLELRSVRASNGNSSSEDEMELRAKDSKILTKAVETINALLAKWENEIRLVVHLPISFRSTLLGRGASLINKLQDKHDVSIQMRTTTSPSDKLIDEQPQFNEAVGSVYVTGDSKGAQAAVKELLALAPRSAVINVPILLKQGVMGHKSQNLRNLRNKYEVQVNMPLQSFFENVPEANPNGVETWTLYGSSTSVDAGLAELHLLIDAARSSAIDSHTKECVKQISDIPQASFPRIVGGLGKNLIDIATATRSYIELKSEREPPVIIIYSHTDSEADEAEALIRAAANV